MFGKAESLRKPLGAVLPRPRGPPSAEPVRMASAASSVDVDGGRPPRSRHCRQSSMYAWIKEFDPGFSVKYPTTRAIRFWR